jgi:hypothetical protein
MRTFDTGFHRDDVVYIDGSRVRDERDLLGLGLHVVARQFKISGLVRWIGSHGLCISAEVFDIARQVFDLVLELSDLVFHRDKICLHESRPSRLQSRRDPNGIRLVCWKRRSVACGNWCIPCGPGLVASKRTSVSWKTSVSRTEYDWIPENQYPKFRRRYCFPAGKDRFRAALASRLVFSVSCAGGSRCGGCRSKTRRTRCIRVSRRPIRSEA